MNKIEKGWCPECSIGLNNREIGIGKCQNCGATWDPNEIDDDEDEDQDENEQDEYICY